MMQRSSRFLHSIRGVSSKNCFNPTRRYGASFVRIDPPQLPRQYLRTADPNNFDANTSQRTDVEYDDVTGKPQSNQYASDKFEIVECRVQNAPLGEPTVEITWKDGFVSRFPDTWIRQQEERHAGEKKHDSDNEANPRIPWSGLTEDDVRNNTTASLSTPFHKVVLEDSAPALTTLYTHGILLVTDTPIHESDRGKAAVAALAAALGGGAVKDSKASSLLPHYRDNSENNSLVLPHGTDGPLRTLYGTVWSTRATAQVDGSTADSAYSSVSLPLHTDMTYHTNPPGLQIFTMVQPANNEGGASVFADGLYCAEQLRREDAASFAMLATVPRTYRCLDQATGWHLEATAPVITMDTRSQQNIRAIRHNDLDRLPDLPPPLRTKNTNDYYKQLHLAHTRWDAILARDETRLVMRLRPGDTMVVANHRCFHGRYSFETTADSPRIVMGCYVCQDELDSRFRQLGLLDSAI